MAAPVITAAPPSVRPAPARPAHRPRPRGADGLLLAVCGVAPKAGTSLFGRLLALAAAQRDADQVLFCHAQPDVPRRSRIATRSRLGFVIRPPDERGSGPHVLTAIFGDAAAGERLGHRLARARGAYALTVVDCATPEQPIARYALAHATHRAWVLPATADGLAQARDAIEAAPTVATVGGMVIARGVPDEPPASPQALRELADRCGGPLILTPALSPRQLGRDVSALQPTQIALEAALGVLTRTRARP